MIILMGGFIMFELKKEDLNVENSNEIILSNNWKEIINNINDFHEEISKIILNEESLYYYTFNTRQAIVKQNKLSPSQLECLYSTINGIIKNPDKYEDYYKPILEALNNIDLLKNEYELKNMANELGFKYKTTGDFEKDKEKLKKRVSADRGYGLYAEILSYIINEKFFNAELLLSKISCITAAGTFAHGSDGIFYNSIDDSIVFGEAKFAIGLDSGIKQAITSISDFGDRLTNDVSYIIRQTRSMKNYYEERFEELKPKDIMKKKFRINVFVLHGEEFQKEELEDVIRKNLDKLKSCINFDAQIRIIVFPIINKIELVSSILKELDSKCHKNME